MQRIISITHVGLLAILILAFSSAVQANDGLPASYLLDRLPADALEVGEAVKTAKVGEEIVLRGRITDGSDVFVPNRAIFRLADEAAIPSCCPRTVGDHEPSHHACGVPASKRATVQFLDEQGQLLRTGLRNKYGLAIAKEVFIVGTVHQANQENVLIVNATGLHVPAGNVPFGLFRNEQPDDVQDIPDVKQNAKPGDEVVIRGRVGGSKTPFVTNRAVFTIVGDGPPACSDIPDDHCETPWDYCCAPRDELRAKTATIQLADDNGAPLRTDINGRRGIRELSDLTIKGTVVAAQEDTLVVDATGLYVISHPTD